MTEVSVVFTSDGKLDVQEREGVEEKQEVGWKVQSFNRDISKVKITFKKPEDKFFATNSGESHESPERSLTYSDGEHPFASATIYGRAPEVKDSRPAKYTVIGISTGQDIWKDPVIVIHTEPTVVQPTSKQDT